MASIKIPATLSAHDFCPGCGHGIISRLLHEAVRELGREQNCCLVIGIGCCCHIRQSTKIEYFQSPHGRGSAVATGMKRVRPDMLAVSYQGDGDAIVIGLSETINAAYRNENITVIVVNNGNFGMTGGQMSWTTLPQDATTTSPQGRDCTRSGAPFHMPELIAREFDVAYIARGSVHDQRHIRQTKRYISKALGAQLSNRGYSMVEIISPCPTNWHMSPLDSLKKLSSQILNEYPVGEFKKLEG